MKSSYSALLIVVFLAACAGKKEEAPAGTDSAPVEEKVTLTKEQVANAGILIGAAVDTTVSRELIVNGTVDVPPQNIVSVSFPLGGYLKSTKLLPGMRVSRGEVIGMIEDQGLVQLQQDYLVTKSKLQYLKLEYDRQKTLSENKVNAEKIFQLVQADYQSQQVMLKGYEEKLLLIGITPAALNEQNISRTVALRSPINGYVSKVNVNIGKYVNPTDVLFELINPDDIHAALTVFEKDISKIRKGQRVDISFVDDPSTTYKGEVLIFSHNLDDDRSGIVHCHFETRPRNLMPGMFLTAKVKLDNSPALTVPDEAVVRYEGKHYVFESLGNNEFHLIEVKTDTVSSGILAISSQEHDLQRKKLVVKNAYSVLGKMKNTAEEE